MRPGGGEALIRPLPGTRPRGADRRADQRAEDDLRSSVKGLAEHRMLVDLARNDLGRVCRPVQRLGRPRAAPSSATRTSCT